MEGFDVMKLKESFARFERAAAKGHEESIWILSVVKDVEMKESALMDAFADTEDPLGRYFVGLLSSDIEVEAYYWKWSAEGGCSWGQCAYGWQYDAGGECVEKNEKVFLQWLEKAADQNNPMAMEVLGDRFEQGGQDNEKVMLYRQAAAKLGWKRSMRFLADMFREGELCEKNLRQASIWSSKKVDLWRFRMEVEVARRSYKKAATADLGCDFNQLCYSLGWGLYWYFFADDRWERGKAEDKAFGTRCLDYYCSCVELQQKSIFTFLLCWQESVGVKDVGVMIGKMVWEGREDNLLKLFEPNGED
jgi:hypothetical protein